VFFYFNVPVFVMIKILKQVLNRIRSAQQLHMMFKNFSFSAFEMKNERLIEVLCQSRD